MNFIKLVFSFFFSIASIFFIAASVMNPYFFKIESNGTKFIAGILGFSQKIKIQFSGFTKYEGNYQFCLDHCDKVFFSNSSCKKDGATLITYCWLLQF
ncbi:hypothetical protein MHBO_001518 [Bonamia ostreae]|uniref:Transmembrane protein n=1 Tax=Bonamia ostreae TaxID=126728 RepID=A0ABV2AJU6_9EUKA